MPSRHRVSDRLHTALLALLVSVLVGVWSTACSSGAASSGATREIADVHHYGILVPENPSRVVTLSEPALDGALALGVTPIGTVAGRGMPGVAPYLAEKADGIPVVSSVGDPDFEKIASLKPDLIITDGTSLGARQDALDTLGKIAPVVYAGHAGGDWKENLVIVGDALNKADEAARVIEEYDTRTAEVGRRLAGEYGDKTFSVVRWLGSGAGLILKELLAGQALQDVGLSRPPSQDREGPGHSEPVATEKLSDIDADYMFFGTLGGASVGSPTGDGSSDVAAAEVAIDKARETPGFSDLRAVKEDHVIPVDGYWTSAGGPILMRLLVDDIDEALR